MTQLLVIAKAPVPGRVKTRLCPPCSPTQAARLAEAALVDTLAAVAATPASRHVLVLDGEPGPWVPAGFAVVEQCGGGLGDRLAHAFDDAFATAPGPVVLVGMDTPQVTPMHLARATARLDGDHDAVVGAAPDGGYWLIGLARPHPDAFAGVPMSADDTGARQRAQLARCGYRVTATDELVDVDTADEARQVAAAVPGSAFARAVRDHLPSGGHRTARLPAGAASPGGGRHA